MPRACTICAHPRRDAIDRELICGRPIRRIAAQCAVTEQALRRHKATHLPAELAKASQLEDSMRADDLLAELRDLHARARAIMERAERAGDLRTALGAIRELRSNLELLARLLGELESQREINVLVLPEWWLLRTTITSALAPFPEAGLAVAHALREIERAQG